MTRLPSENLSRRDFVTLTAGAAALAALPATRSVATTTGSTGAPIALGTRRELFVDDLLIDRLEGKAERRLHHPTPREIALVHDASWEGSGSGYHSVFRDGDRYRMYYKAWHLDLSSGKVRMDSHPLYCCYAESEDGVRWHKPDLGLVDFRGSRANNIVIASGDNGSLKIDAGHPAVFKDENPNAPEATRYKAFVRSSSPNGLIPMGSPDGLHWSPLSDRPVITDGAFDSQNLAFWDPNRGEYRAYWRFFTKAESGRPTLRAIRTATSPDFIHWGAQTDLTYVDSPPQELYTNVVKPYHRAPQILLGFPTRYTDRGWTDSAKALPEREHRELRSKSHPRYGTVVTEALVMAGRDGQRFRCWNEAFLRPGPEREGTWNYGHQYLAWHVVETKSDLPGAPDELSFYATESYWTGNSSALRRYTLRLDGFVSVNAPLAGGTLTTPPLTFTGRRLELNLSTSAAGGLTTEILDAGGEPIPGFSGNSAIEAYGDAIERVVTWKNGSDVSEFQGKLIRLRFTIRDADLYAFRFVG